MDYQPALRPQMRDMQDNDAKTDSDGPFVSICINGLINISPRELKLSPKSDASLRLTF